MKINTHSQVTELWEAYQKALLHYLLKMTRDPEQAEHLCSEVLLKIYASCCSGRTIKNIRSWLFQIAHNTCVDHFRKSNKTKSLEIDIPVPNEDDIYRDAANLVEPLIGLLPDKYSQPLVLAEIKNLKHQQVAQQLGLSLPATKSRILRAKKMLQETIVECIHIEVDASGHLEDFKAKAGCKPLQNHLAQQ